MTQALPPLARPAPQVIAYLSLAASMVLVGSYVGLSKLLVAVFPVFLLAWLRFAIAALAMAAWTRRPADEPALGVRERRLLFLESFLGNFMFSICMLFGVMLSTALTAGVVMAALPAVVGLLSWALLGERPGRRVVVGIACAVGGIGLVSLGTEARTGGGSASALGTALLVLAVFCEASYVVIGKQLTAKLSPRRISALVNLWGLALVTPMGWWQARTFDFAAVPAATWLLLVFYSLAASMVSVWLWMTGLRQVPASQAGVFSVMLPVSAAAVGLLVLGERVSGAQAGAFGLALVGLLVATWPQPSSTTKPNKR